MTLESDTKSDDILHSCPIDDWDENTDIETWAEQYGNHTTNHNTSNYKEWNAEITEAFNKLEADITKLFHSKAENESVKLQTKIEETFKWCNDNRDKFTEKQFKKVQVQCRRWQSVVNAKVRYFNNGKNKCQATAKDKNPPIIPSLEQVTEDTKQPLDIIPGRTVITGVSNDGFKWKDRVNNINSSVTDEFPLNETTLCFENMTEKQRRYFTASPFELNEQDEPLRYIRAYKWLRNPGDADRLFGTFYERVIAIVGKDIKAQERYINEWNRYCEQAA